MKKLIIIMVVLIVAAGGAAWFLLQPGPNDASAEIPKETYNSSLDLPIMPVPIISGGISKGALYMKFTLLFSSEENEAKTRKYLPYLYDHLIKEMHIIAPNKSIANGTIDPASLEKHLQTIIDDVIGGQIATIRIKDMSIQAAGQ